MAQTVNGAPGDTAPENRLPLIQTPRLVLRPRCLSDLADCLAMDREPQTVRWVGSIAKDPEAHEAFIRARMRFPYPAGMGYWTIRPRTAPKDFAGWIMLIPEDTHGPRIEIGWRVPAALRGQGYATEAARAVLDHGLALGFAPVIATIRPGNTASRRVATRIGMRLAARRDRRYPLYMRYEAQAAL